MKAIRLATCFFFIPFFASFAQSYMPLHTAFSYAGSSIGIFSDYTLNSNAITHDFIQPFYKGTFIETKQKDRVFSRLLRENRLGADVNYGLYYVHLPDSLWGKSQFGLFFSLRDTNHVDMRFSDDFF